jgi:Xaa-Pro dipeptidase
MSACLSLDACRQRQARLRQHLAEARLDAALVMDSRHIHYLCGYWRGGRVLTPAALLVTTDGRAILVAPSMGADLPAVENLYTYVADRIGTLVEDLYAGLIGVLRPHLTGIRALGTDGAPLSPALDMPQTRSITPLLQKMRRTKDPDEIVMLRTAIDGCSAAYSRARELLNPGATEVQLYAGMLSAAIEAVGEPLTDFGNDFQCGALGSLPRNRQIEAGETAIFDVGVVYRGYSADLCRTFVVGGEPTGAQTTAHRRVLQALEYVEAAIRPGVRCKAVYQEVYAMLEGFQGCTFPHHLGHGIGLSAHEAPRLNPHWDDTFQIGDVFTAEPGLYGDTLRAGIRVEQNYVVTSNGLERLSHFPVELA